jgi:predicted Zn-dependent peptidase
MSLDSLFNRGMLLGRLETVARWTLLKEFVPKTLQVTAPDIQRVAKKYLVPENRNVGILSPLKTDKPTVERYTPGGQIK